MTEVLLLKILDVGLFAASVGVKRAEIVAEAKKLSATPELIPAALARMAAEALDTLDSVTK
jgi:hypothetical protein